MGANHQLVELLLVRRDSRSLALSLLTDSFFALDVFYLYLRQLSACCLTLRPPTATIAFFVYFSRTLAPDPPSLLFRSSRP